MNNNWKTWKTILVVGCFIAPTLLLVVMILRSRPYPKNVAPEQIMAAFQPAIEKWKSLQYSPIEDPSFSEGVKQITIKNIDDLNDIQKQQIRETLSNWIMAYHVGTIEAFRRFRTPVVDFHLAEPIVDFMKQDLGKANQPIPSDQDGLLKVYWEKYANPNNVLSNYWTAISFSNSVGEVQISTNVMPHLKDYVMKKTSAGLSYASPMLTFNVTPETTLKKYNKIVYVTVSLMAYNNDVPYPVYCRFYWAEDYGKWLPLEQVAAYSGPRRVVLGF